mgnify:CR=1 FL=1
MAAVWVVPALLGAWRLRWWRACYLALHLVPLAAIPASVVDPRYFSAANIKNRLESYFQMVKAKRGAAAAAAAAH